MTTRPTTYVAVDYGAIEHNARQVLAALSPGARLCAVVKANAYGHGMVQAAAACLAGGSQWLGVSTTEEGVRLREAGVAAPVLVFMPAAGEEVGELVRRGLTATVVSSAQVMELSREAERQETAVCAHVYQDLGLGRIGGDEALMDIISAADMARMKHNAIVGNIGHFDNEIDVAGLDAVAERINIKPQVDEWKFEDGHSIIMLSEGRLLNLGNATGHPSFVMSNSFANQTIAQIELWTKNDEYEKQVYVLPKHLDEKVARLHLAALNAQLTELRPDQAAYIGVPVEGPYKPDHYRY